MNIRVYLLNLIQNSEVWEVYAMFANDLRRKALAVQKAASKTRMSAAQRDKDQKEAELKVAIDKELPELISNARKVLQAAAAGGKDEVRIGYVDSPCMCGEGGSSELEDALYSKLLDWVKSEGIRHAIRERDCGYCSKCDTYGSETSLHALLTAKAVI